MGHFWLAKALDETGDSEHARPEYAAALERDWPDRASPERNVKPANHRIAICNVRTRPMRSANHPASHPPKAETISAAVPSNPACPRVMPQVAISAGITKL